MRKLITSLFVVCGVSVFAQRTATTFKSQFVGTITSINQAYYAGNGQWLEAKFNGVNTNPPVADVSSHFGDQRWTLLNTTGSINAVSVTGIAGRNNANDRPIRIYVSPQTAAYEDAAASPINISANPIVYAKVINNGSQDVTLQLGVGTDTEIYGPLVTIPSNSLSQFTVSVAGVLTSVGYGLFNATNNFQDNYNLVIKNFWVGAAPEPLAMFSITGPSMITATGGNITLNFVSNAILNSVNWSIMGSEATLTDQSISNVKVNAKRNGIVTITAVAIDDFNTVTGIRVVQIVNQIESLSLSGANLLTATETSDELTLTLRGNLSENLPSNVNWVVTPSTLVGITGTTLRARGNGVFTIKAVSKADNTVESETLTITVAGYVPITGVTISGNVFLNSDKQKSVIAVQVSPSNATNPRLAFSLPGNQACGVGVDLSKREITAKANGIYTFTGTVTNGNSTASHFLVVTVTNQLPFFDNFTGTWDGNMFGTGKPTTYNTGFLNAVNYFAGGLNGWIRNATNADGINYIWNSAKLANSLEGTSTDKLDVFISTPGANFASEGPFWENRIGGMFFILGSDAGGPWNLGCGVGVDYSKKLAIDIENKEATPLQLLVRTKKRSDGDNNFNANIAPNLNFNYTIPGNTRMVIDADLSTYDYFTAFSMRAKQYVGNTIIHAIAVGAGTATGIALTGNASAISNRQGNITVSSAITGDNAVNVTSFTYQASRPGLVSLVSKNDKNIVFRATGNYNGFVTVTGKAALSSLTNQFVFEITNQGPSNVVMTADKDTIILEEAMFVDKSVSPIALSDSVTVNWSVIPANAATYNSEEGSFTPLMTGQFTVVGMPYYIRTSAGFDLSNFDASIIVTVLEPSLTITGQASITTLAGTTQLNATLKNSTASVMWVSSNSDVATVSGTGLVQAISDGITTIVGSVVASNYTLTSAIVVTVSGQSTGIISGVSSSIKVYPNPVSGTDVSVDGGGVAVKSVTVVSAAGISVLKVAGVNGKAIVPTSGLSKGLYILLIETDKGFGSKTLSVE